MIGHFKALIAKAKPSWVQQKLCHLFGCDALCNPGMLIITFGAPYRKTKGG